MRKRELKPQLRTDNIPQFVEIKIRLLPTFYPITACNIQASEEGYKMVNIIQKNIDNIKVYKTDVAKHLQDLLDIQVAIIEHGYGGIGDNIDYKSLYKKNQR